MTIVATIILKLIFSSSIIHPKKTAITGLTLAKVLAKVAVVFLKIQKNPNHPVVPTIINARDIIRLNQYSNIEIYLF